MYKGLFLILLTFTCLWADSLDTLLTEYSQKDDLSEKTKIENSGHLLIYTRHDLDKMQAKSLKDVLKSISAFTYEDSRYNLPDIYNAEQLPFKSNSIRVYIDNQELTTALYGSGLSIFGDISLGFVNHVEVYLGTPSYKFSTESAFLIVKLYSKTAQRDMGGVASTVIGDDKYSQTYFNYVNKLDDTEYQVFTNFNDNRQDKINHKGTELSKDKKVGHLFAKVQKDTLKLNVQVLKNENDAFINRSLDATPLDSYMKEEYFNINLEKTFYDNTLQFYLDHTLINSEYSFVDDNNFSPFFAGKDYESKLQENVTTFKMVHENDYGQHHIFTGIDFRNKAWKFKALSLDNVPLPQSGFDNQQVVSVYFQDEYWLTDNSIFTFGAKYSDVKNNGGINSDNGKNIRIGHILTTDRFTFKTYLNDASMMIEPYLITSNYGNKSLEKEQIKLISHETSYETESNKASIMFGYSHIDDAIMYNYSTGKVFNVPTTIRYKYIVLRDEFQILNLKNHISFFMSQRRDVPVVDVLDYRGGTLRTLYTLNEFDLFSEFVYRKNDESSTSFYDLSLGIKKEIYKDLLLSFKGENILNKAYATNFNILSDPTDITSNTTISSEHTPKRFLIGLEYRF